MGAELWAITTFFNPSCYRQRLSNYKLFRKHLNVPLLTVELGYGGKFDLQPTTDAEILLQLPGESLLWQKERLLNIALDELPAGVEHAAVLDCDVIFEQPDWPRLAAKQLRNVPLVQLYSEVAFQPRGTRPGDIEFSSPAICRKSLASLVDDRHDLKTVCLEFPKRPGFTFPGPTGLAWGIRRDLFRLHKFYDLGILGGGDVHLVAAIAGCQQIAIDYHQMNAKMQMHYLQWANSIYRDIGGQVGCIDGRISHLWHGATANRRYATRYADLSQFEFDPYNDIAFTDQGTWRWASDKPAMHEYVKEYFISRMEDG